MSKCVFNARIWLFFAFAAMAQALGGPCNPSYVQQQGALVTVAPTSVDDTANLRCAIDYAGALGPGVTVQLMDATYKTAQIVVQGFNGTIRGAGIKKTTVQNSDTAMPVHNPTDWWNSPPSEQNSYPTLISVIGDNVVLSDMAIRIVGNRPTTPWYWLGTGPWQFVVPAVSLIGSHSTLRTERIEIAGSDKCFPDPEGNVLVDIEFWNFASQQQPWPSTSTLVVVNSVFKSCGGIFAADVVNANILVTQSTFDTLRYAVAVSDVWNSTIEASGNDINVPSQPAPIGLLNAGIDIFGGNFGTGIRDSSLLFRNNRLSGFLGIVLEDNSFHGSIPCGMVGNNVEHVTGAGYWFRPGTYGCTVVGHGKGTVLDETGGAHTVVGMTSQTGGVGHALGALLHTGRGPWGW